MFKNELCCLPPSCKSGAGFLQAQAKASDDCADRGSDRGAGLESFGSNAHFLFVLVDAVYFLWRCAVHGLPERILFEACQEGSTGTVVEDLCASRTLRTWQA